MLQDLTMELLTGETDSLPVMLERPLTGSLAGASRVVSFKGWPELVEAIERIRVPHCPELVDAIEQARVTHEPSRSTRVRRATSPVRG